MYIIKNYYYYFMFRITYYDTTLLIILVKIILCVYVTNKIHLNLHPLFHILKAIFILLKL
jgi:nitrogen fixation/metabolism regulation signal transduction histidine kinase